MQNRPFTGLRHPHRDKGHPGLFFASAGFTGLVEIALAAFIFSSLPLSALRSSSGLFRSWRAVSFECSFQRSGPGKQSLFNACPGAQASNAQASSGAPSLQGTSPTGARREPHGGVADCRVHRRPPSEQRNEVPTGKRGNVSFLISARALCQYVWISVVESIVCSFFGPSTE